MMKEIRNIQKQHPQHSKITPANIKHRDLLVQHYNMEKIMAQHDERNSQHSQHSKNNTRNRRDLLVQHYNIGKNHVATSTHVTCNIEQNSATFKNNICNIQK
jgi:hypothetical protein